MADLRFNDSAGRFVDSRGRFVAEARVRAVVDSVADQASDRLEVASRRLLAGELSLASWQAEAQTVIRTSHAATAVLAHGGAAQMTPARWGAVGPEVKAQYRFLADFAEQIRDGRQPLDGRLIARSRQYGQAASVQYERARGEGQQRRGYLSERNVLRAGESCSGCREQSARGWVAIGSLVPVGQRSCRSNCRCRVAYRREPAEAAA